jgi:imidazolonepropionase-like amidohydrolase
MPLGRDRSDELELHDLSLAARLSREGVRVILGSGGRDPAVTRDLPLLAGLAIAHGLGRDAALEAVTIGAARVLDVADRIGSLEAGKDADLLVLDGPPLETTTNVRFTISSGRVVVTPEN